MKEKPLRELREQCGLSLREAAKRIGVTHPYLSALELGHKRLTKEKREKLAELYGVKDSSSLVQPSPFDASAFQHFLAQQIQWWDSRFVLPKLPAVTSRLSDIYVNPTFVLEGEEYTEEELLKNFCQDKVNRGLILSGPMGSGKTTFLRSLALNVSEFCKRHSVKNEMVPFLVSLGSFQLYSNSITKSLVEYYVHAGFEESAHALENTIRQAIDRGQALLLFDGLDEIPGPQNRSRLLAQLQHLFEGRLRKQGNKFILSGQSEAFVGLNPSYSGFRVAEQLTWSTNQMVLAAQNWPWPDPMFAEQFCSMLFANETLYQVAKWPLLFHLLTTLFSAGGFRPFREMTALCNACLEVLEESWSSARPAIQPAIPFADTNELEALSWLKWRFFLIFLVARTLSEESGYDAPRFSFRPGELSEAWELFLEQKGVLLHSAKFAELEDLIRNNSRIGPIVQKRVVKCLDGETVIQREYTFIENIFGCYYIAKALCDSPRLLAYYTKKMLRDPQWRVVIALALQELERSERSSEQRLGEEMLQTILSLDDELGLEKKEGISHAGIFTAMLSIAPSYSEKHWEEVILPFIDIYMTSIYARDIEECLKILGSCGAINKLRRHFLDEYQRYFVTNTQSVDFHKKAWRVLPALTNLGEHRSDILRHLTETVRKLSTLDGISQHQNRILGRRLLWSLYEVGRVFSVGDTHSAALEGYQRSIGVSSLHDEMDAFRSFAYSLLREDLANDVIRPYPLWDMLIPLLNANIRFERTEEVRGFVQQFLELFEEFSSKILTSYPWKHQLLQFIKSAANSLCLCENGFQKRLLFVVDELSKKSTGPDLVELSLIYHTMETSGQPRDADSRRALIEKAYGPRTSEKLLEWIGVLEKQRSDINRDYSAVAHALVGLYWFFPREENELSENLPSLQELLQLILTALKREHAWEGTVQEEIRVFVLPFSPRGFPLFDLFHMMLNDFSTPLPLSEGASEKPQRSVGNT